MGNIEHWWKAYDPDDQLVAEGKATLDETNQYLVTYHGIEELPSGQYRLVLGETEIRLEVVPK